MSWKNSLLVNQKYKNEVHDFSLFIVPEKKIKKSEMKPFFRYFQMLIYMI